MASGLKQLKTHVKSVGNIQKVTGSMKMVSAARFIQAERLLVSARPLGVGARRFYDFVQVTADTKNNCIVPVTSDRGLCGSCHSKVSKRAKQEIKPSYKNQLFCLGEKSRSVLGFEFPLLITYVVNGLGHRTPTFKSASAITTRLIDGVEFDSGTLIFPMFKNMLGFEITVYPLYNWKAVSSVPKLVAYNVDDEASLQYYIQFSINSLVYYSLCESYLVELSARIQAMSSASKNANKLKKQLSLQFNRLRQSLVTKELTDIIGGASVVTKKKKS